MPHHPSANEVVISMRPVSVLAKGPGSEIEQLRGDLHGQWRQAIRAVMILLSVHGLPAAQITDLLGPPADRSPRWHSLTISALNSGVNARRCRRGFFPCAP